jgi:hypothetical protein
MPMAPAPATDIPTDVPGEVPADGSIPSASPSDPAAGAGTAELAELAAPRISQTAAPSAAHEPSDVQAADGNAKPAAVSGGGLPLLPILLAVAAAVVGVVLWRRRSARPAAVAAASPATSPEPWENDLSETAAEVPTVAWGAPRTPLVPELPTAAVGGAAGFGAAQSYDAPALVAVAVRDSAGQVLLMPYAEGWNLPAGPLAAGEDTATAAGRLLGELTGWPMPPVEQLGAQALGVVDGMTVVQIQLPTAAPEAGQGAWGPLDAATAANPHAPWVGLLA